VLAIAAARLGFAPVTAIDNDPVAIEVAERNAAANGVPLDLYRADATTDRLRRADVAVVNVTEQVVAAVAPRLQCRLLVSSGYYDSHRPALRGYRHVERRTLESWAADLHERE
jgi:ribosomal protein L11 methyltransferase